MVCRQQFFQDLIGMAGIAHWLDYRVHAIKRPAPATICSPPQGPTTPCQWAWGGGVAWQQNDFYSETMLARKHQAPGQAVELVEQTPHLTGYKPEGVLSSSRPLRVKGVNGTMWPCALPQGKLGLYHPWRRPSATAASNAIILQLFHGAEQY